MNALERRGLRNLQREPKPLTRAARWVVRIYYRSEGGEILCCVSDPLPRQAAETLAYQHRGGRYTPPSDAIASECILATDEPNAPLAPGARRVVLPHQQSRTEGGAQ